MNAVEKLEAAITKLEGLRDQSGFAPWGAWKVRGDTGRMVYGIEDAYGEDIATIRSGPESELIEILHRTIEPQLAILREARDLFRERLARRAEMSEGWRAEHHPNPDHLWPADIQPLAIADAILGAPDADVG